MRLHEETAQGRDIAAESGHGDAVRLTALDEFYLFLRPEFLVEFEQSVAFGQGFFHVLCFSKRFELLFGIRGHDSLPDDPSVSFSDRAVFSAVCEGGRKTRLI